MKKMKKMRYKENKINNIDELRLEIVRLKLLAKSQEDYLGNQYALLNAKVAAPIRFINKAMSWIPGVDVARELFGNDKNGAKKDWVSRIFSAGSTAVLNRLFLRRAGLFKRILLSTITQQAAGLVNKDRVVSFIKSMADYIRPSGDSGAEDSSDSVPGDLNSPAGIGESRSRDPRRNTSRRNRTKKSTETAARPATPPDFGIPPDSESS